MKQPNTLIAGRVEYSLRQKKVKWMSSNATGNRNRSFLLLYSEREHIFRNTETFERHHSY